MQIRIAPAAHAAALVLLASITVAQGRQYTLTNLGTTFPGTHIAGAGLSDTGHVAVWQFPDQGALGSIGYRWSHDGLVRPEVPAGVSSWAMVTAVDADDEGSFVGSFGTLPGTWTRGYRCKDGTTEELLTPLGFRAYPTAMNGAGWIVGYAGAQSAGTPGAVLWSPDLTPSWVADLSRATDVNDLGHVVGTRSELTGTPGAFLWDGTSLIPLGTIPPADPGEVFPMAVNDAGVVVGRYLVNGDERAFAWTQADGMRGLPDLGISSFPFDVGARDVNAAGWIVGYAPNRNGQTEVLWTPAHEPIELETLVPDIGPGRRWVKFGVVAAINDAGQISGTAASAANFETRTVLLTPADLDAFEPSPGVAGVTNTIALEGCAPGRIAFLAADLDDPLDRGYTELEGCAPLGIALHAPRIVATAQPDGAGRASFSWNVPSALAGRTVRLQAWQPDTCELSQVVRFTF